MKRKSNESEGFSLTRASERGDLPYKVDNIFYETFGMSFDEVFESLKKSDFFELK